MSPSSRDLPSTGLSSFQAQRSAPRAGTYPEAFGLQADKTPDLPAVILPGDGPDATPDLLTFADLDQRATQLAHRLHGLIGVERPIVALYLERSVEAAIAPLAIWKAGGSYLPLDPAYPAERLAFILEDAGAACVLTTSELAPQLPETEARTLCLDTEADALRRQPFQPLPASAKAEDPAYVIYTSGSTGKPKGVLISHRNLLSHNRAVIDAYGLRSEDRFLQFASISFDISVEEIFPSWLLGAPVIFKTRQAASSISALLELVQQQAISVLNLPTAYWHELVYALETLRLPDCIRLVIIGGEAASSGHYLRWLALTGGRIELINAYGPTETTVTATCYRARGDEPDGRLLIGQPLPNATCEVIDAEGDPVAPGTAGELVIGGAGVGLGYLHRPELTAERFEPDPCSSEPGARRYRTGDRVRQRDDGALEFLGRLDEQVKWHGYRIELDEVRLALTRRPEIADAIVVLQENAPGGPALAAYCVPAEGHPFTPEALRHELAEQLPEFMVPSAFIGLARLPLTANGKVDRRALPPIAGPERPTDRQPPPRTPTERALIVLWEQAFNQRGLSPESDFISLGGHSLLAARLAIQIKRELGVDCSVPDLMQQATVARLAEWIDARRRDNSAHERIPVHSRSAGQPVPLTRAQQRLWFLWRLEPSAEGVYIVPIAYRLRGTLNLGALNASLTALVARHDALRLRFSAPDGKPQARLEAPFPVTLTAEPLAPAALVDALSDEARRPFDLHAAPPWRARLFQLSETEHVLAVTQHHIITDGHSVSVLGQELGVCYAAACADLVPELPTLRINFCDYAWWQQAQDAQGSLKAELSAWSERLRGYQNLDLPTDHPRPPKQSFRGGLLRFQVDPSLTVALKQFATEQGSTLFMLLLGAYGALLQRYAGQDDLVIGVPVTNRPQRELEPLLGLFVNTLPLRLQIDPAMSFRQRVAHAKSICLQAFEHQNVPLERLLDALEVTRDRARPPLFQTLLSLLTEPLPAFDAAGVRADEIETHAGASMFDLSLYFEDDHEGLRGYAEYNADLFTHERIRRMIDAFETLLRRGLAQPDQPFTTLDLLPDGERELLLQSWNHTERDYPLNRLLHELIDEQAMRTPDRVAALSEGASLTYEALRQRSNQLAARLQALGVRPNDLVGVCLSRSPEMLVGLLGVLKAGAAYVPLDPDFPASRLAYMVEHAAARLILTETALVDALPGGVGVNGDDAVARVPRLLLDQERDGIYSSDVTPSQVTSDPESLAYVIYTSGSTGQPKGVQISHRAAVNFLLSMQESPGISAKDRVLALTTLSFDIAVLELYLPLITGATVWIAPRAEARDSFRLRKRLTSAEISLIQATPATYRMLLDAHWRGQQRLRILCGGEPLPADLAEALLARGSELWNMYGPTETTVWSTVERVERADPPILIGRPIANTSLYILDTERRPVPIGVTGELWIGGNGTASGYLNRPDLTAERFIPNPFGQPGLIYNTGDLARYHPDGRVECLGRSDFQVKISGHRLELGEIELALKACPEIQDCVVTAFDAEGGGKRLAAYIIAVQPDQEASAELLTHRLRAALMERLPDYMIPAHFVQLERFPLTPNGKVDRKALPKPKSGSAPGARQIVTPYTPEQEALCECYKQVLGLSEVSIKDNFFELGGDSLTAIQVIDQLHKAGLELTVESMFRYDSIEDLATVLSSRCTQGEQAEGLDACLVTLREGDPARLPPLFLAHSPPGDLLGYVNLVQCLDQDQPIYGFQSLGLTQPEEARDSIEAMAEDYCALIQKHFPDQPFSLAGWCLGGTLVYEMACQLAAAGRPPALVALFDTQGVDPEHGRFRYVAQKALSLLVLGPIGWGKYIAAKLRGKPDQAQELGFRQDASLAHVGIFANRALVREKNMYAVYQYRSKHYPGEITVFQAERKDPTKIPGFDFGWRGLVANVDLIETPGDHDSVLKPPNVEQLATLLERKLQALALKPTRQVPDPQPTR